MNSQSIDNIFQVGLNFIYHEVVGVEKMGPNSSKFNCTVKRTYNIPYAYLISKKLKLDRHICLYEVYAHLKNVNVYMNHK